MNNTQAKIFAPVIREVVVNTNPQMAFDIFVNHAGDWWPTDHSLVTGRTDVIIEAKPGGRWYETGENGTERQWGVVLAVEPGKRLLIAWQLSDEWAYDPNAGSEVEVTFTDEKGVTRVVLEHRNFENMGPKTANAYASIASDSGWTLIFGRYGEMANN